MQLQGLFGDGRNEAGGKEGKKKEKRVWWEKGEGRVRDVKEKKVGENVWIKEEKNRQKKKQILIGKRVGMEEVR